MRSAPGMRNFVRSNRVEKRTASLQRPTLPSRSDSRNTGSARSAGGQAHRDRLARPRPNGDRRGPASGRRPLREARADRARTRSPPPTCYGRPDLRVPRPVRPVTGPPGPLPARPKPSPTSVLCGSHRSAARSLVASNRDLPNPARHSAGAYPIPSGSAGRPGATPLRLPVGASRSSRPPQRPMRRRRRRRRPAAGTIPTTVSRHRSEPPVRRPDSAAMLRSTCSQPGCWRAPRQLLRSAH